MHPPIRTYGRIHGRATLNWPFDHNQPPHWFSTSENFSFNSLQPQNDDIIMEIGFGMGTSLYAMAENFPNVHFIGVEVYEPGVLRICKKNAQNHLNNLTIIQGDALACLQNIPPNSLDRIHVFFPDPWPKLRHHKRRLHRGLFFDLCQKPLKNNGRIHLATDIEEYALDWIKHKPNNWQIADCDQWIANRQQTKYESRGKNLGHNIIDIVLIKHHDI